MQFEAAIGTSSGVLAEFRNNSDNIRCIMMTSPVSPTLELFQALCPRGTVWYSEFNVWSGVYVRELGLN